MGRTRFAICAERQQQRLPRGASAFTPAARANASAQGSADPALNRRWRVRNSNPYEVTFTWDVYGTAQSGGGVVPAAQGGAPGEVFFETQTVAGTPNTARG